METGGELAHTRKQVQMSCLVRNFACLFEDEAPLEFGECFGYNKVFLLVDSFVPLTMEKFVEGGFSKYINNDGSIFRPGDLVEKAECFCHY